MKTTRINIRWTEEEKKTVLKEIRRLYLDNPNLLHQTVLELVMHKLPISRRKTPGAIQNLGTEWSRKAIFDGFKKTAKEAKDKVAIPDILEKPITIKGEELERDMLFIQKFEEHVNIKDRPRVIWSPEESNLVLKEVFELYRHGKGENLSHDQILMLAQQALGSPRWRKAISLTTNSGWTKKECLSLDKDKLLSTSTVSKIEVISTEKPSEPEINKALSTARYEILNHYQPGGGFSFTLSGKAIEKMVEIAIQEKVGEAVDKLRLEDRLQEVVDKVGVKLSSDLTSVEDLLLGMVEAKALGKQKLVIKTPEQLYGKRHKIAVINVLSNQATHIKEDLKMFNLDITVYLSDAKSFDLSPNFDKVFIMTKFTEHAREDAVRRVYPNADVVRINGGMHALKRDIIKTMYPDYMLETQIV